MPPSKHLATGASVKKRKPAPSATSVSPSYVLRTTSLAEAVAAGSGGGCGSGSGSGCSGDAAVAIATLRTPGSVLMAAPPPPARVAAGADEYSASSLPDHDDGDGGDGVPEADSRSSTPSVSSSEGSGSSSREYLLRDHHQKDQRDQKDQKDQRIAQLESELDRLGGGAAESEAATLWQAKLAWQQQRTAQAEAALRQVRDDAGRRDDELRALRLQVRGLKERVSTATRADGLATSDEVFGDGMARLANGLQNWVIVHFRRAKLRARTTAHGGGGDDNTGADELARRLVPVPEVLRRSAKLHLLQSAVSRLLVEHVFAPYYVGLSPDQAAQLSRAESTLLSFAGSQEPINQWRALTLAIVSADAAQQLPTETSHVIDAVVARVNSVLSALTVTDEAAATTATSDSRDQALRTLVASAIDLSRLLVAQRAVFRVFMPEIVPHQQLLFDAATMDDMGGEEDDDDRLARREVACVTFPGIIKHGDETGGHLQYRNVICKARVICVPVVD